MIILDRPRLEVIGNFAFAEGRLVKDIKHYSVGEVWGKIIAQAKGISRPAYSVTTISYNSRRFEIFVIPYKEIGGYYTKTIPHKAHYTEYYQVLWGNPLFEAWRENESDGTLIVRKGAKRPLSAISIGAKERLTIFNQSPETAVVLGYASGALEDNDAREALLIGPNVLDACDFAPIRKQEVMETEKISLLPLLRKACEGIVK